MDYADRVGKRALMWTGGWIRTDAKQSIKQGTKTKKKSLPGQPPLSHTEALKRQIFFAWTGRLRQSVVVGPQHLTKRSSDAPRALEVGGRSVTSEGKSINVEKRPYMKPSYLKALRMRILQANIKKASKRR